MAAETMRSFLLFETLLGQFEVTLGLLWGHFGVALGSACQIGAQARLFGRMTLYVHHRVPT